MPEAVTRLTQLPSLHLNYNDIKRLPHTIFALRTLRTLDLRHNEQLYLPPELLEKNWLHGAQVILRYIEQMHGPAAKRPLAEAKELEGMEENYLPHSRYEARCAKQNIDHDLDRKILIDLLNDLGVVIHYQDDRRLHDTNILNPEWVTQGIYRILNANALFQSKGVLALRELGTILDAKTYPPDRHEFLIGMMRKFELCFPFEGEEAFLIPELLSKEEPELLTESDEALGFEYWYPVLPQSVISRFIVRMHTFISKKTSWRTGVVLDVDGNKAVVKADLEGARIAVAIHGPERSRRRALAVIRSNFDHIHGTIPGLNPEEKVPVPGQACKPVDYRHLLKLERKGIEKHLPEGAEDEVSVALLLDGIESREERLQRGDERRQEPEPRRELAPPPPRAPPPVKSSPWGSGSFYLVAIVVILGSTIAVAKLVAQPALPFVLTGGALAFVAVIAAQLFHDKRLTEKGFLQLMSGMLQRLALFWTKAPGAAELSDGEDAARPKARAPRSLPASRPKELPPVEKTTKDSGVRSREKSEGASKQRKRKD